jgi:F-type H+-transporting ATPase subunit delta
MYEYLDRRYALALYEVADQKGKAEEYLDELSKIISLIYDNEEFMLTIKHPHLSTFKKKEVFESVFKGKIDDEILAFFLILIEKDRLMDLKGIEQEMNKIHLDKNKTVSALVKTVVPLTYEERAALKDKLESKYNKKVIFKEKIDKDIIGGVFIKVGNDIIDGTIKSRLEDIRRLTLKAEQR